MSIGLMAGGRTKERILLFAQASFFFLLFAFPVQKKIKIFKAVAASWSVPFHFPEPFQQNIYFFLTDLPLFLFPLLLFSSFSLSTFFAKSSRFLTLLFFVFLLSLLLSSSCPLHYARLSHFFLFIVLFSALEKGLIFQNIRNWFPKIALLIVGLSLVQCLFGILQYCLQNSLGL
ncbi:MAG: hypothetical protein ACHQT8_04555, partial [Chlamydiales bacterium]